jgi:hypothetical protein
MASKERNAYGRLISEPFLPKISSARAVCASQRRQKVQYWPALDLAEQKH